MSTQHPRTVIATGTCLTFGVALAVAVGAIPQASGSAESTIVATQGVVREDVAHLLLNPAYAARQAAAPVRLVMSAGESHIATKATSLTRTHHKRHGRTHSLQNRPVAGVTVESGEAGQKSAQKSAQTANIKHATPHKKKHHKKKHHHKKHATKPAAPVKAARTKPSASAVSKAIAGLRSFVRTPFSPNASQVAQFGDAVCTAFDQHKTFGQVKAEILAQVKKLPFTTVTAGAADYVVKTAVSLYCPGYKSKVS